MTVNFIQPVRAVLGRSLAAALVATLAAVLVACGGGGSVPYQQAGGLRPLSAEFGTRKAVSYSPFRSGNRDTEVITAAMVKQDLDLLLAGGFRLIRLFDSSDAVTKLTLQVISDNKLDIKVMLGAYVGSSKYLTSATAIANVARQNDAEVARAIALANSFKDIVLSVSVGNETMVSWSFGPIPPAVMAGYLATVRNAVTQPVTTDDNWAFYADSPKVIRDTIDFASVHTYPLSDTVFTPTKFDWRQEAVPAAARAAAMMDAAINAAKSDYNTVRTALDSLGLAAMPIIIGETGWKAVANGGETARAHPVNQKMYLDRLNAWGASAGGPKAIVYFEAFDEPWKGADDKWALFNVNRQARYAIQSLYPAAQWEPGTYTAADAVYFIPTVGNSIITASRYTVYAEAASAGEAKPSEVPLWNAWSDGKSGFANEVSTTAAPTDPSKSIEITPRLAPEGYGWGMALTLPTTSENLSNFAATGTLNFSIKTMYPGKIEVGFLTGTGAPGGTAYDVYLVIDPAANTYGYLNDGNWHRVSIPIAAITPRGAPSFGNTAPTAQLDLTKVTNPFVIADRYVNTGKPALTVPTEKIYVDAIFWAR